MIWSPRTLDQEKMCPIRRCPTPRTRKLRIADEMKCWRTDAGEAETMKSYEVKRVEEKLRVVLVRGVVNWTRGVCIFDTVTDDDADIQ